MADSHLTSDPITVDQVEAIARSKLPLNVYNYYSCGSDEQIAVERNRTDFDRYVVRLGHFENNLSHELAVFSFYLVFSAMYHGSTPPLSFSVIDFPFPSG